MLIAIDGPAGAGKSSVARALARELGYTYLDTGAMYRAVALRALEQPDASKADLAARAVIALYPSSGAQPGVVTLDGRDVSGAIREPAVSEAASELAADPGVREALVAKQQAMLAHGDWVAEGRDIGTVVAPWAQVKVFLTASAQERARRRAAELGIAQATVAAEQAIRDQRDSTREHGALRKATDAVELDTTGLTLEQVVEQIAGLARGAGAGG
jgi:cytidylate kinase